MPDPLTQELAEQITTALKKPEPKKIALSRDIYVAVFKEGPIQREYRFYAPGEDLSIVDEDPDVQKEKRQQDRNRRIYNLCKRYERFLRSQENKKVVFVGIPQPFVVDFEARMASFESNFRSVT